MANLRRRVSIGAIINGEWVLIMAEASDPIVYQLGRVLQAKGIWLCTAESCTGGLIAHRITNMSGSSGFMLGGVVAYANRIKENLLKVRAETLQSFGAVSPQTAEEMAIGALALFDADVAVSVTGIAGPGGGSAEKPVGLVYSAVALKNGTARVERNLWSGDRESIKQQTATRALEMVLETLYD